MPSVFLDLFTLRRYDTIADLVEVIEFKKNGQPQTAEYVAKIVRTIEVAAGTQHMRGPLCPFWHFNTRKAIEMWPKEVYRDRELLPLTKDLKFGPLVGVCGPRTPVTLLKRAFGADCFDVYYQSSSHNARKLPSGSSVRSIVAKNPEDGGKLPPKLSGGGEWEGGKKMALKEEHYIPMQPEQKIRRRKTAHCRERLMAYLAAQTAREAEYLQPPIRPRCTVYIDGVFDLFHVGHLRAIEQCAALGDRVIVGVTGDDDAAGYKRPPVVCEDDRVAVIAACRWVDEVICPCPLVVTEQFMGEHSIDLVVHGFSR